MSPEIASVGLVGKAPAQADFIRVDAGDAAAQEFLRWIQEADDGLRRTGSALPPRPTAFLFTAATQSNALVGVMTPSRDQVGRVFPLAVFAVAPAASLADRFALVPLAFRSFLAAATALLEEAASLTAAQLTERVRALPRPSEVDWRTAEDERRALLEQASASWVSELVDLGGPLGPHYAFRTFVTACKERAGEPPRAAIVLACPLGVGGPLPWLDLASRILRWKAQPPALLWTESAPPRLLLCLGGSLGNALSYLARPDTSAPALWSMKTAHVPAQEAARDGLSAQNRTAIEQKQGSMAQLLTNLAP
jgi:type VI secretion system protein ImpM